MSSLPTPLRRQLESTIKQARKLSEGGARHALEALAVHEQKPYDHMNDDAQRDLRNKLRAQAKQLGDGESQTKRGVYEIKHLSEKLAYDQWHRLLFARYLLENNLLISPEHGVSVTIDDCEELGPSLGLKDSWAVAARFAAKELPEIFRADDPSGAVEFSVNDRLPLIQLVTGLPAEVFTASDSLGWCYQYWQAEEKTRVNDAGNKIGADDLPAVTQLFTEDYMVDFLLDNTLGAWHAGKILAAKPTLAETALNEDELRSALTLPGCPWKYLRFIKDEDCKWMPAAGIFGGWPKMAKELTCLDPCMGSGHFVVAMFERLVVLRMTEENLDESAAVASVISDNLFGLEIDPRCTQIAAFNLALAAWRRVGHCKLPAMNLACSGLAPNTREADWLMIAGDNDKLKNGMARLYRLFQDAPMLGSLINPRSSAGNLFVADYHELQPLIEKVLAQENQDESAYEMAVTARGLAKAAEILVGKFTIVATNVPYLGRGKQDDLLKDYCEHVYTVAKADLATCFVQRCLEFCAAKGSVALVTPQNWLFLGSYKVLRTELIKRREWNVVARLGEHGFQSSQAAGAFTAMLIVTARDPELSHAFAGFEVSKPESPDSKASALCINEITSVGQQRQLGNPDARLIIGLEMRGELLLNFATTIEGLCTGDSAQFITKFWEHPKKSSDWEWFIQKVDSTTLFGGRSDMLKWEGGAGALHANPSAHNFPSQFMNGRQILGKAGIRVAQMRGLPCTLYNGEMFGNSGGTIVPHDLKHLPAVWAFCSSSKYVESVRLIDQKLNVTIATLAKVEFDLPHWQKVAEEMYPLGLPKPFSSDPSQWLFDGHPKDSDQPLHVAVARLLCYQWPRQTGSSFPDCSALASDGLEKIADDDGIVCLSATKGEAPAAERLRGMLVKALGTYDLSALLASAGPKGSKSSTLEEWLRDEFFEQHCALFHQCPFIWHIWDGHKNGFSALVNYHQLTHANLEKLTYSYLGADWIRRQQDAVDSGEAGSDARLQAAKQLQTKLKLIIAGEPPYDLFVRWKPLSQQAIGWQPDLNDGVRLNIRPFATADILRKRVKISWGPKADRGKEPKRDKAEYPWFWGWDSVTQDFAGVGKEPDGNRWNDCHYSNEFKNKARETKKTR